MGNWNRWWHKYKTRVSINDSRSCDRNRNGIQFPCAMSYVSVVETFTKYFGMKNESSMHFYQNIENHTNVARPIKFWHFCIERSRQCLLWNALSAPDNEWKHIMKFVCIIDIPIFYSELPPHPTPNEIGKDVRNTKWFRNGHKCDWKEIDSK